MKGLILKNIRQISTQIEKKASIIYSPKYKKNLGNSDQQIQRENTDKYGILQGQESFEETFENHFKQKNVEQNEFIHRNLKNALKQNNYRYVTPIQKKAVDEGILQGKSMIIQGQNGSGKTLAYLMPIINQLEFYKDRKKNELDYNQTKNLESQLNKSLFLLNHESEDKMFQNAQDIEIQQKRKNGQSGVQSFMNSLSYKNQVQKQLSEMKGALILSYSKELVNQIYLQARSLDFNQKFLMNRATSSLQMKSPIVEYITPDLKKGEKEYSDDELFNMSLSNVINNSSWQLTDILFTTPVVISHILDSKSKYSPLDINPKTIVIDEFDELLNNLQLSNHLVKILKKFASTEDYKNNQNNQSFCPEVNRQRQFIFCGSSISKQLNQPIISSLSIDDQSQSGLLFPSDSKSDFSSNKQNQSIMENLTKWMSKQLEQPLEIVKTNETYRISENIEHEWIDVGQIIKKSGYQIDDQQSIENSELQLLVNVIKKSLNENKRKSIIVFAESKKTVDNICNFLKSEQIKSLCYYPEITVQSRAMTLMLFQNQQLPVLVCNNLASRGLDTMNAQHIIQFEFPKTTLDYFQRCGRIGRMGQKDCLITNFIRQPQDIEIAQIIAKALQNQSSWENILSSKSPRKKKSPGNFNE